MNPNIKILIVDDFATMRRIIRNVLKELGYENCEEAEDGAEGLTKAISGDFQFIVSDINMPNKNGFEMLEGIRANGPTKSLPVLMVTAEARKEDSVRAAQLGASGYIVKPFTKATLEEKLNKILAKMTVA